MQQKQKNIKQFVCFSFGRIATIHSLSKRCITVWRKALLIKTHRVSDLFLFFPFYIYIIIFYPSFEFSQTVVEMVFVCFVVEKSDENV